MHEDKSKEKHATRQVLKGNYNNNASVIHTIIGCVIQALLLLKLSELLIP
jgi:hypothetical protein